MPRCADFVVTVSNLKARDLLERKMHSRVRKHVAKLRLRPFKLPTLRRSSCIRLRVHGDDFQQPAKATSSSAAAAVEWKVPAHLPRLLQPACIVFPFPVPEPVAAGRLRARRSCVFTRVCLQTPPAFSLLSRSVLYGRYTRLHYCVCSMAPPLSRNPRIPRSTCRSLGHPVQQAAVHVIHACGYPSTRRARSSRVHARIDSFTHVRVQSELKLNCKHACVEHIRGRMLRFKLSFETGRRRSRRTIAQGALPLMAVMPLPVHTTPLWPVVREEWPFSIPLYHGCALPLRPSPAPVTFPSRTRAAPDLSRPPATCLHSASAHNPPRGRPPSSRPATSRAVSADDVKL